VEKIDWPTIHTPVIPKSRVKGENLEDTGVKRKFEKKPVEEETGNNRKKRDAADKKPAETESGEFEEKETAEKDQKKKIDIHV